jgi:hypothetical protein
MINMDDQTKDRLDYITNYHNNSGIPTRRFSEEHFTSPSSADASKATRDMTRDTTVFSTGLIAYGFDELKDLPLRNVISLFEIMMRDVIGLEFLLEVDKLFSIDLTASSEDTIRSVYKSHPVGSIPHALCLTAYKVSEELGVDIQKSMQFCMRYVNKQFPRIVRQSNEFISQGYTRIEASRLSIQFILGNIDGLLSDASNLAKQGVLVAKALSAMFTRDELLKYIYEILKKS